MQKFFDLRLRFHTSKSCYGLRSWLRREFYIDLHRCCPADQSLVVALSGLAVYSGDFILSTIQRVLGTAIGLVWGMVIWYVGSEYRPSFARRGHRD